MSEESTLDDLTGGAAPPAPPLPARPQRPAFGGQKTLAVRKPGQIPSPASVPAAPSRDMGGFAASGEKELRHMQRIDQARAAVNRLVGDTDKTLRQLNALVSELKGADGGAAVAERMSFPLDDAARLVSRLEAVLEEFFPKS